MSRIGKLPIEIPSGVSVTADPTRITVKGPQGELSETILDHIKVDVKDNTILVTRANDEKSLKVDMA